LIVAHAQESHSIAARRTLEILEILSARNSGLTHSEISRKLEIPKSSLTSLLRALESRGYLRRDRASGKYRLGLKILALAGGVQTATDISEIARPVLEDLARKSGLTAHLAVLDRGEAVYVEKADSPGSSKLDSWVGKRLDLHSTAVGKALLAFLGPMEVDSLLQTHPLKRKTAKTICTQQGLLRELDHIRTTGYAVDDEENVTGNRCVGGAVLDHSGRAIAAIGLSGSIAQLDKMQIRKVAEIVKKASVDIRERIG
jgi:IclR family acetate operon transcriptional repressor